MADTSFLGWPFFEPRHRELAAGLEAWCAGLRATEGDVDEVCRGLVRRLGADGWLAHATPPGDVRSLCLIRETLARHAALADFAFALQGLGSGPIALSGTEEQKRRWLPAVREGRAIAAFALSEPDAGSDVAAITTTAHQDGSGWRLAGTKTWISNGGIADFYVVFARTGEAPGARGLSAFIVEAAEVDVLARLATIAPHPLATLQFAGARGQLIGRPGDGFKIAMATLDLFRPSVGAAALGLARRALDLALDRARGRSMFGGALADLQLTQAKLADMATGIDASALLVYRAAWARDAGAARITREAAMAKLFATETAQRVIDEAVQIHGAQGVETGRPVEALYREIRALRIYEGASEVQQLIIARQLLQGAA